MKARTGRWNGKTRTGIVGLLRFGLPVRPANDGVWCVFLLKKRRNFDECEGQDGRQRRIREGGLLHFGLSVRTVTLDRKPKDLHAGIDAKIENSQGWFMPHGIIVVPPVHQTGYSILQCCHWRLKLELKNSTVRSGTL